MISFGKLTTLVLAAAASLTTAAPLKRDPSISTTQTFLQQHFPRAFPVKNLLEATLIIADTVGSTQWLPSSDLHMPGAPSLVKDLADAVSISRSSAQTLLKSHSISLSDMANLIVQAETSVINKIQAIQNSNTCNLPATESYIASSYPSSFPLTHASHGDLDTITTDAVDHIAWIPYAVVTQYPVSVQDLEGMAISKVESAASAALRGPNSSLSANQLATIICDAEDSVVRQYPTS